ncbi:hypothetical protein [uncultured Gammaproteobacteria bacterium]|nr:hypothetical protein [uncultured Gammaproteobacteria bacterium]
MVLTVPPLPKEALLEQTNSSAESSEVIRERVLKAHNIQFKRQGKFNDKLTPDEIEKSIPLISRPLKTTPNKPKPPIFPTI